MSSFLKTNKFFVVALVLSIVLGGLTFGNMPGPTTPTSAQTINGTTFNFAEYKALTHEQVAIHNYLATLMDQPYGEWEGWYCYPEFYGLFQYVLAFMGYSLAMYYDTTPGYRTSYYADDVCYTLLKKMNTTYDEWGNSSIEYMEWLRPGYDDYYYPVASDPSGLYMGGYRGPTNIMWTGHYALMGAYYERNFGTGRFTDELTWYIEDWYNSMTTDGYGNPKEGGIWGVGLVPCEPYEVWVQCNAIPIPCTELYDNLYGTNYMESGMWDFGLNFCNEVMRDDFGLYIDGYYVMEPLGFNQPTDRPQQEFPGLARASYQNPIGPYRSRGYGVAWSLAFLEYTQPEETINDYPKFLEVYGKEVSGDQMYFIDSYNNPTGFGTYEILDCLFTLALAKQRDDFSTRDRILNFLYNPYNKIWENNGREMHYDTTAVTGFLQSCLAYGWLWGTTPVTLVELSEARPTGFWDWPYISAADDDNIWVYQAEWDSAKDGFILNIRVDEDATLTFSNFDAAPTAYSGGVAYAPLEPSEDDYTLDLSPGTYYLVIM